MADFSLSEIAGILHLDAPRDVRISGFVQDSNLATVGNLFFAMKGKKTDGHAFLCDVAKRGGVAAVVSNDYCGEDFGLSLLRADDVLGALHALAKAVHAERKIPVIGVTGSVGKTTTKEFIATLLEGKFKVAKTPGNANSQVSMPLSILNTKEGEEVFVIEMGMTEKGEIERLVRIAPPEIAVVTPIAHAHIAFFPDGIEGIARAKAEILASPLTRLAILHERAAHFSAIASASCAKILYGEGTEYAWDEKQKLRVRERGELSPHLPFAFEASHLRENFLAAVAVARALGMQWKEIITQIPKLALQPRRFETVVQGGIVFINDSYNANAISMKAALQNLPSVSPGNKKIAVLGAMRELGEYERMLHQEVAQCALQCVDRLLCLGEECRVMVDLFQKNDREAELFLDFEALKKRVFELAQAGDVVLLKASKPLRLWSVLE
ncbi:MAG TPA: UDP-N-acetylmuramoyl-tripeptide--D-alanyl-D-alanine ligase [Rhabdochlamydiaceae bacterium]|jgi:UDP-N-acetylmuramoyl-tripeptide--D-alanyl-D-alanine ligase